MGVLMAEGLMGVGQLEAKAETEGVVAAEEEAEEEDVGESAEDGDEGLTGDERSCIEI